MKEERTEKLVLSIVAGFGIIAFLCWFLYNPVKDLKANVPGLDNRPLKSELSDSVIIGEKFKLYGTTPSPLTGKWPRI